MCWCDKEVSLDFRFMTLTHIYKNIYSHKHSYGFYSCIYSFISYFISYHYSGPVADNLGLSTNAHILVFLWDLASARGGHSRTKA